MALHISGATLDDMEVIIVDYEQEFSPIIPPVDEVMIADEEGNLVRVEVEDDVADD